MEVTSILGKTHFRRVLFPVGKHMRGGAENNEASPRHLPALLSRKYNTPPGRLPPPPLRTFDQGRGHEWVIFLLVALEMDLKTKSLKLRAVWNLFGVACPARRRNANFVWFFSFFEQFARAQQDLVHTHTHQDFAHAPRYENAPKFAPIQARSAAKDNAPTITWTPGCCPFAFTFALC